MVQCIGRSATCDFHRDRIMFESYPGLPHKHDQICKYWACHKDVQAAQVCLETQAKNHQVQCLSHLCQRIFLLTTIFPWNLAARFHSKAQFGAATIWGRLHFKGSIYRDQHVRVRTRLLVCTYMYNARAHTYIAGNPLPCGKILRVAFIGTSIQETWSKISRAAGFQGTVRFRGNMVLPSPTEDQRKLLKQKKPLLSGPSTTLAKQLPHTKITAKGP